MIFICWMVAVQNLILFILTVQGPGSHDQRVADLKALLKPSPSALVSGLQSHIFTEWFTGFLWENAVYTTCFMKPLGPSEFWGSQAVSRDPGWWRQRWTPKNRSWWRVRIRTWRWWPVRTWWTARGGPSPSGASVPCVRSTRRVTCCPMKKVRKKRRAVTRRLMLTLLLRYGLMKAPYIPCFKTL